MRPHLSHPEFSRVVTVSVGLLVGLLSHEVGAEPTSAAPAVPTELALDPIEEDDGVLTGAVCTGGHIRCLAHAVATETGALAAGAAPTGLSPADLQSAYLIDPDRIPAKVPVIAIVDAFGYPNLEADLATYRQTFGLPPCTVANGCLTVVNQEGKAAPLPAAPPADNDWSLEIALDVDMASSGCPKCKILVIEVIDDTGDSLFVANRLAAQLGATVVSNSWGIAEVAGKPMNAYETYFDHPGITVFASAGDDGYNNAAGAATAVRGPNYPSTSAHVISVGGTKLEHANTKRGWVESAWAKGGSSCSLSIPKPGYQEANTMCQFKASTDIAAVGDPQTGAAVFHNGAWSVVGGTSAAAPLVAAIFAGTNHGDAGTGAFVRANADKLYDVQTGTNGTCGNILCTAGAGWDGPTGYGTPNAALLDPHSGGNPGGPASGDDDATGGDYIGGCSAGRSGGLAIALALLGLIRRRR